jgi:hypothetical protein
VSNELSGFVDRLKSICKLMGAARIDCDNCEERWIDIKSSGKEGLLAQIRSTHLNDLPVWEIIISDSKGFDLETVHIERRELNYGE